MESDNFEITGFAMPEQPNERKDALSKNIPTKTDLEKVYPKNPFDCQTTLPIFNIDNDFGRESLGLLPNVSKELDGTDFLFAGRESVFGRESISFTRESLAYASGLPRESLGILNFSALDVGRESLKFSNVSSLFGRESIAPRESLGVLNMAYLENQSLEVTASDITFQSPIITKTSLSVIPEIKIQLEKSQNNTNDLNTAFVMENSRKTSVISSCSASPSFDSHILNEPSNIYSLSTQKIFESSSKSVLTPEDNIKDQFNDAAEGSENFRFSCSDSKSSVSSIHSTSSILNRNDDLKQYRARIQSMPVMMEEKSFEIVSRNHSFSGVANNSLTEEKKNDDFIEEKDSDEFGDSVFIEANQIAEKIADGSIYEETTDKEMDVLEQTPQPDWPCVSDMENSEEKVKVDKNIVFKSVDKMLPNALPAEIKLKNSRSDSTSSIDNHNVSNKSTNRSNLSNNNLSRISHLSLKSDKNTSRLLKNLSDILKDNEILSKSQKSEGQSLLHSLADILKDTGSRDLSSEDSGHSSILENYDENDKDLGLESKNENNPEAKVNNCSSLSSANKAPLHIPAINRSTRSSISRYTPSPSKVMIQGISFRTPNSSVEANKTSGSNASASSIPSNNSKNSSICKPSVAGKLKAPKPPSVMKKGPLKAVLPIGEMRKNPVTPRRSELDIHCMLQSKRTSTPLHEPKLKPMAASTPTTRSQKPVKEAIASPLARPKAYNSSFTNNQKSSEKSKVTSSPSVASQSKPDPLPKRVLNKSLMNTKIESSKLMRRNSVSDVQKPTGIKTENPKLKRSNSVGKETKIMSALSKVRQNILMSPYFDGRRSSLTGLPSKTDNVLGLSENKQNVDLNKNAAKEIKTPNTMMSKMKKPGKENMAF